MMRFAAPKKEQGLREASHPVQAWKQGSPNLFELGVISEAVAPLRRFGDAIAVAGCGADRLHRSCEFRIVCNNAGAASDKRQRN